MAKKTTKSTTRSAARQKAATETQPGASEAYEAALGEFARARDLLQRRDYAEAKAAFEALEASASGELELIERARTYARICANRLAPAAGEPATPGEQYHRAVLLINDGRHPEAIQLLDRAIDSAPQDASLFYARASAWALQRKIDAAVSDLRRATAIDPKTRFQAANDPDFEGIRDDAAFIDIVEPTPAGG